jgi:hypothetical protein
MPLLVQHLGGGVVVAQVGRGHGPEILEQGHGQAQVGGQLGAVVLQQLGQAVGPVDPDGPLPGQVVEADVLQLDPVGGDPEQAGEAALEPDGRVAQPDGPVAPVEQGLGDDPDRVGEVDQPGPGGGPAGRLGRQLEHHRDGAQGLGEPARPGRLLPDAAELERQGLVHQAHGLATDAQLHDHEVGPSIASSRRPVACRRPPQPTRASMRPARPPTTDRRSPATSNRASSSTGSRSERVARPSTSSGV